MKQIIFFLLVFITKISFSQDTLDKWNGKQYSIFAEAVKFKPKFKLKGLSKIELKSGLLNINDSVYNKLETISIENCIYDSEVNFKQWNTNYTKLTKAAWSKYCHRFIVLMQLDNLNTSHTVFPFAIDYNKTLTESLPEIQKHLLNLKFKYYGSYDDTLGKVYAWCQNINETDTTKAGTIFKVYFNNNGSKGISFLSSNKNDYFRFKLALGQSGFTLTKFEEENNSLHELFLNSPYEANIFVTRNPTTYEMSLDIPK